jgi:hypothetical protein
VLPGAEALGFRHEAIVTEYKPPPPPSDDGKHGGRRPQGPRAMTDAERQAAYRRRKAEDRVKALARAAMFKWEYENLVGRYGKAVVRKGPEKRVRRGPQRSRRVTGHLMAEAEADLECRRRVKRELLAAFYTLAKTVQEIVMRANIDDEGFERLTDLLEVLDKGVYTMADAEALGFRHEAIVTEYKPPPPPSDDAPKKRSRSAGEDESLIRQWVRPELGGRKVVDVGHRDVERLHAKISKGTPTRANRIAALLSKAFALAITWEWRPDNPCGGYRRTANSLGSDTSRVTSSAG